jgi:hypothetical protein
MARGKKHMSEQIVNLLRQVGVGDSSGKGISLASASGDRQGAAGVKESNGHDFAGISAARSR